MTIVNWVERLRAGNAVRVGNPLLMRDDDVIVSLGGPEELIDALPEPGPSPLDLVPAHPAPAGVDRFFVVYEGGATGAFQVIPEGQEKPLLDLGVAGETVTLETLAGIVTTTTAMLRNEWIRDPLSRLFEEGIRRDAWARVGAAAAASTAIPEAAGSTWRSAQTEVEAAGFQPSGILLHPADWQTIEEGLPDTVAPVAEVAPELFLPMLGRLAVLSTPAMAEGTAVLGDLRGLGILLHPGIDLFASQSNRDDFLENRVSIRGETLGVGIITAPARLRRVSLGG